LIYGKSIQDGTPTPTSPVPIISLYENEKLTIKIDHGDNIKCCSLNLPNGLAGIQVIKASQANYTDSYGVMWCCDEIDLERGVYIKRLGRINPKDYKISYTSNKPGMVLINCADIGALADSPCLCNRLINTRSFTQISCGQCLLSNYLYLYVSTESIRENALQFFTENEYDIVYILKTPVEIPLDFIELSVDYNKRMNSYYPEVIRSIAEFQAIIDGESSEFEGLSFERTNVLNNAYLTTMDEYRIKEWEKILKIKPLENSTVDDRRDTVIARIRGQGKLNTALINTIVNTFTGGSAVSWVKDSVLYVMVTPSPTNKQYRFENVEQELKTKVPAHLGFQVSRNYYTWNQTKETYSTWQDVKDNFETWNDVYIFVPF
jgi:hypothetical protein